MLWALLTQQRIRLVIGGIVLGSGFIIAELLRQHGIFAISIAIFPIGLAALIGTGKLASP